MSSYGLEVVCSYYVYRIIKGIHIRGYIHHLVLSLIQSIPLYIISMDVLDSSKATPPIACTEKIVQLYII